MTGGALALLGRTVAHLQPAQVAHRARLRAQRAALRCWPELSQRLLVGADPATVVGRVGWPDGFTPLDAIATAAGAAEDGASYERWPTLGELSAGRIGLLGMTRSLGEPVKWQHDDAPQLWRFHLQYWDWAWGLAAAKDRTAARAVFARLWRSWQESCRFGRGDAWLPYPTALRAWSWCGLHRDLVAGTELQQDFLREMAVHAGFLRRHLEFDVGGNHLIKDLKALAGLGVFLGDERLLTWALQRLISQLAVQILPDGGHYERAPAYHCQVLGDLIDVTDLVREAGRTPAPEFGRAIDRMRLWLGAVLTPDKMVPLLNDGYPVSAALLTELRPGPAPDTRLLTLPDTGLVRAAVGGWRLIADVGAACPDELPAHAHADTLGCLVHVDGAPLLVDTGTSTYEAGPVRSYERSTAAHNTAELDGADSTEVWGAFRAGRRARVRGLVTRDEADCTTVEAAHNGYRWLPGRPVHRRRWSLTCAGLQIDDEVTGGKSHAVAVRWHLAPGSAVELREDGAVVTTTAGDFQVAVGASGGYQLTVEPTMIATGFQRRTVAPVLTCRVNAALPVRITTGWRRAERNISSIRGTV